MKANAVKLAVQLSSASAPIDSVVNSVNRKSIAVASNRSAKMAGRALKLLIANRFVSARLVGSAISVKIDRISVRISRAIVDNA